MIETLVGGFIAILGAMLGGFLATWWQIKKTRQVKMDEVTAVKKVETNAQAYSCMKELASMLVQNKPEDVLNRMLEKEEWFFNSRLFLPGKYPDKWLSLRNNLRKFVIKWTNPNKNNKELVDMKLDLEKLANDAIDEIYKEMKLQRIEPENID